MNKKLLLISFLISQSITQSAFSDDTLPKNDLDLTFSTSCDSRNQQAIISFVGDILIHKALYQAVISETKHFNQIWKKTDSLIQKADFSVANLEGPAALGIDKNGKDRGDIGFVYDDEVYSGTNYIFNYHPRILSDLKDSGFDLITSANNHSTDRLGLGIDRTILAARTIGLPTVGTRKSDEPNGEYFKIVPIKNMRVAFVGCTEYINIPDNDNQVLFCENEKIFKIIKEVSARPDVDALVVLPHWGVEYSHLPRDYQREYARRYLEAGAIAVMGSHPHVLQPWEKYTTKNGRETLILYSLGNFVAAQVGLERQTGTVAYIGISKNGTQKAKIFGVAYTPTYRTGTSINPIGRSDSPEVLDHISHMYGTLTRAEPNGALLPVMCPKNIK
ncbi:MAG: CapA family protein [Bacteriovorax sp.]|nr:CapA family protein [Bacteriovorax sp.]